MPEMFCRGAFAPDGDTVGSFFVSKNIWIPAWEKK